MGFKDFLAGMANHKADLMFGAGVSLIFGGTIAACAAAVQLPDILEEHNKMRDQVQLIEDENEKGKLTTALYVRTFGKFAAKLAGPITLELLGLTLIGKSYKNLSCEIGHLKEINAGLAASLAAETKAFSDYRKRVVNKYGEEEDQRLLLGEDTIEITDIPAEGELDEKGKPKKPTTRTEAVVDSETLGDGFTFLFTRKNVNWKDNDDYAQTYFTGMEHSLEDRLYWNVGDKCLTLNEALEDFQMDKVARGLVAGWHHDCEGHDHISLKRVQNANGEWVVPRKKVTNEFGELEDVYVLQFNCAPDITGYMKNK